MNVGWDLHDKKGLAGTAMVMATGYRFKRGGGSVKRPFPDLLRDQLYMPCEERY